MISTYARRLLLAGFLSFLLPILLPILAVCASAQVYVFGQASFVTGGNPDSVISADLNSDGRLDLIVGNRDSNSITVLLGKPDGTFAPGVDYVVGKGPGALISGDFNGDGIEDLAVNNADENTVSILLGKGDGTFQGFATLATGGVPTAIATGDLNQDGKLDLVVANDPSRVSICLLYTSPSPR